MSILLKSVKIVDSNSRFHLKNMDILIEMGKISSIKPKIEVKADKIIKISNLHISNGWFDSSVSFGEPGYEERETLRNGLLTAAKSGFTSIALNPLTNPVIDDNSAITALLSRCQNNAVKVYPVGALTVGAKGKDLAELFDMHQAGAVSFGDYKKPMSHANLLKLALQYAQNFDGLVQSFPNDRDIAANGLVNEGPNSTQLGLKGIPSLAEELQIERDLAILEYTGGKLHIPTISTEKSVRLIRAARKKGLDISCSVAIYNLMFTDNLLAEFDTNAKLMPPLRGKKDINALKKGLRDGTIDMVSSDHFPVDIEHKRVEFENALFGSIGLESSFGALNALFGMEESVSILNKGKDRFKVPSSEIAEGNSATLTLFDPETEYKFTRSDIFSTSKNSLFLNNTLKGKALGIIHGEKHLLPE